MIFILTHEASLAILSISFFERAPEKLVGELMFICELKCGSGGKRRFSQAKRSVFDDIQFSIGKSEVKIKKNPESCRWKRKTKKVSLNCFQASSYPISSFVR
jgi:hypothetical protein